MFDTATVKDLSLQSVNATALPRVQEQLRSLAGALAKIRQTIDPSTDLQPGALPEDLWCVWNCHGKNYLKYGDEIRLFQTFEAAKIAAIRSIDKRMLVVRVRKNGRQTLVVEKEIDPSLLD